MALTVSLYCVVILLSSVFGGLLPLKWHGSAERIPDLLCVSAGFMVGAIFFHMLPESIELLGRGASIWLLAGFLFLYVLERFMTIHMCEGEGCDVHDMGMLAYIGMSIHTITDGLALGASMVNPAVCFSVFLAIAAHKLPSAFSMSTILSHAGFSLRRIVFMTLGFALLVPAGVILFQGFQSLFPSIDMEGPAVAFACGSFLHIALSDLVPEMHRAGKKRYLHTVFFLLGIAVMFALSFIFREGH
ncbi:MAG: ZIP family metal transporter [Myxococcota bacterium]|jgi:zinc and cadmium transporter